MNFARLAFFSMLLTALPVWSQDNTVKLSGKILDGNGVPIPARLYIESMEDPGRFYHAKSAAAEGSAVPYEKKRSVRSVEIHTCLSAHPFETELPPGKYRLTAERGHEYLTATTEVAVAAGKPSEAELVLERWIKMAERGWYSGDTHCHRTIEELRTVLPAEDLNVGLPLTAWVTDSTHSPAEHNKNPDEVPEAKLIRIGPRHVIWPVNTEYEIFSVDGERHVLGAVFVLNHREPLTLTVPPVEPVAIAAREQGAILDLDKHNWPWSMTIVPIMDVNLFELTNNHVWRTEFAFTDWYTEHVGEFMNIPLRDSEDGKKDINEDGWLEFGFQTYYALLNCGLHILPSGGTASGVHPVPLGFGRVYARLPEGGESAFTYQDWIRALRSGRTFVTTGPMLFVTVAENHPGSKVEWEVEEKKKDDEKEEDDKDDDGKEEAEEAGAPVMIRVESQHPIAKLQLIVNGDVTDLEIGGPIGARAPHSCFARTSVEVERSSWVAVRVFTETAEGRPRFAHSAPVWLDVEDKPIRPKVLEADYLKKRVEAEIERHQEVLSKEALEEMKNAAEFFDDKLEEASVK